MHGRTSKSKKLSDASSPSKQPSELVFFLDYNMGTKVVADELRRAGVHVEIHLDHFAQDAKDEDWLPVVGQRGWIVITKDKGIRRRPPEVAKHLQFGVRSFALTSGNMRGDEMAQAILVALSSMRKLIEKTPPPFVATVNASGSVTLVATLSELQQKVKKRPG